MKVRDLIVHLQDMDPDAPVHFAYNYGDHWRTTVAPEVTGVDVAVVKDSDYHRMPKVVDDEDVVMVGPNEFGDDQREVVVLE